MKKFVYILLCLVSLVAVALAPQEKNLIPSEILSAETASYHSWRLFPGTSPLMKGKGPHGAYITTYINAKGLSSINDGANAMADGTIIVKENYNDAKEFHSSVVMKKNDGVWSWGVLQKNESVDPSGIGVNGQNLHNCQDCHRWAKRDQVFLWR